MAPNQTQGAVAGVGGLFQGFAAGLHNENQLMHELRLEQMAALRMQRYGGMYGGGGTQSMVPGEVMHAQDPNWPIDKPAPMQAYETAYRSNNALTGTGELAGAGIKKTGIQADAATLGHELGSKANFNPQQAQAEAEKAALNAGLEPGTEDYIKAVGQHINMARGQYGLQPTDFGEDKPTTGIWGGIQRAFGGNPTQFVPNAAPVAPGGVNQGRPILPAAIGAPYPRGTNGMQGAPLPTPVPQPDPNAAPGGWSITPG